MAQAAPSLLTRRGWTLTALQLDSTSVATYTDDSHWDASQRPWATAIGQDPKLCPVFHRPLASQQLGQRVKGGRLPQRPREPEPAFWAPDLHLSACSIVDEHTVAAADVNKAASSDPQLLLPSSPVLNNLPGVTGFQGPMLRLR